MINQIFIVNNYAKMFPVPFCFYCFSASVCYFGALLLVLLFVCDLFILLFAALLSLYAFIVPHTTHHPPPTAHLTAATQPTLSIRLVVPLSKKS